MENDKVKNRNSYNEAYLLLRRTLNIVSLGREYATHVCIKLSLIEKIL